MPGRRRLFAGVPLRDREPQHVGERAGVAVGDGAGNRQAISGVSTCSGDTTR